MLGGILYTHYSCITQKNNTCNIFRFKQRQDRLDRIVLEKGISRETNPVESPESLPPAVQRKDRPCMTTSAVENPHVFALPSDSAGTALAKKNKRPVAPVTPCTNVRPPFLAALEDTLPASTPDVQAQQRGLRPLLPVLQPLLPTPQPALDPCICSLRKCSQNQPTIALIIGLSHISTAGCELVWQVGVPGSIPALAHHYNLA